MRLFNFKNLSEDDYLRLPEEELEASTGEMVNLLVRKKYSLSDEIAMLRERDTDPDKFAEYNSYVENCKKKAKKLKKDKKDKKV